MSKSFAIGNGLVDQLMKAGLVPENCKRIVLDINSDREIIIYYELLADERILDIDFAAGIKINDSNT